MERYEKYRDSGIEWIGEIPEHWDVKAFKTCMTINNGQDYKHVQADHGYPVMGSGGQFAYASKYMYDGEVVLLGRKGTIDKPMYYNGPFWTVDTMFFAVPKMNCCCRYMYYLALTFPFDYYATATALPSMTQSDLGNNPVAVPNYDEQQSIANYLDSKCSKIDHVIATQQKRVELLKELKQSIITRAVTRGINPNAKMKDSGVEWIGEIPEHWEIKRVKQIAAISNGSDPKFSGDIPVYGSGAESFKTCGEFKEGPCVLLGRKGATLHIPHYIEGRYWNVDTAFDVKTNSDFSLKLFFYLAMLFDYGYYTMTTTLPSMTQTDYGNMRIPVPPIYEQQQIVSYIEKQFSRLDSSITKALRQIELLKEYKQSLITEVVTGKRKVV